MARFSVAAMRVARRTLVDPDDPSRGYLQIRAGLHSGPCTACIVGLKNPKYTLLGDTINTASRMESTSAPGQIQCSSVTADLIRAQDAGVQLALRGSVAIKGKGLMETYWIVTDPVLGDPAEMEAREKGHQEQNMQCQVAT